MPNVGWEEALLLHVGQGNPPRYSPDGFFLAGISSFLNPELHKISIQMSLFLKHIENTHLDYFHIFFTNIKILFYIPPEAHVFAFLFISSDTFFKIKY